MKKEKTQRGSTHFENTNPTETMYGLIYNIHSL